MDAHNTHRAYKFFGTALIAIGGLILLFYWGALHSLGYYSMIDELTDVMPVLTMSIIAMGLGTLIIAAGKALDLLERIAPSGKNAELMPPCPESEIPLEIAEK